jgi:chemotaxis protein histidine kinase CheA
MVDPLHLSFIDEATTHLAQAQALLYSLDRGVGMADTAAINRCYRAMHTISGLAGFLALERIHVLAQTAERLLEEMRLNRLHRGSARIDALLQAVLRLSDLVQCLADDSQAVGDDVEIIRELRSWIVDRSMVRRRLFRRVDEFVQPRIYRHGDQIPTGPPRRRASCQRSKVGML